MGLCKELFPIQFSAGTPPIDQELLMHYIFNHKQYDSLSRPVLSENESITIALGLALIQIVQVVSYFTCEVICKILPAPFQI